MHLFIVLCNTLKDTRHIISSSSVFFLFFFCSLSITRSLVRTVLITRRLCELAHLLDILWIGQNINLNCSFKKRKKKKKPFSLSYLIHNANNANKFNLWLGFVRKAPPVTRATYQWCRMRFIRPAPFFFSYLRPQIGSIYATVHVSSPEKRLFYPICPFWLVNYSTLWCCVCYRHQFTCSLLFSNAVQTSLLTTV